MTLRLSFLLWLLPLAAFANNTADARLADLKNRLDSLTAEQNQELRARDALQATLREAELRISRLSREQRQLSAKAREAEQRLQRLQEEQAELAVDKKAQLEWLGKTVRASYQVGRQERLKLLLNQEQPTQIARLMRYQEYYQQARSERLQALESELIALREVQQKITAARQTLLDKRTAILAHATKLQSAQDARQQALVTLNQSLSERGSNIRQLEADRSRLETLLQEMQRSLNDIPADLGGKPFGSLAGKLAWPLSGRITTSYNSRREGALRWQGVILQAPSGTPVRAVHSGRVVFADWLRGYGLLTIVDHGEGYLTLYGQNQSLLRDVGEWVSTGDTLALAGNSGGSNASGLYFEVRHKGKASNPTRWCSRRVTLPPLAHNDQ